MTKSMKILIVDDDPSNLALLQQQLEDLGHETVSCQNGPEALEKVGAETAKNGFPGIMVSDIKMPGMDGLELMKHTLNLDADLPVILMTAFGDIPMAVQAMHDGAYDFIEKPFDPERLTEAVKRGIEKRALVLDNRALRAELARQSGMDSRMIGQSPVMIELRKAIANLADTDASVLILGDTGTGKELVAKCLHEFGSRRPYHFVPVNCGAVPENIFESELFGYEKGAFTGATKRRIGKLEYANKGTLFLDEIESMPMQLQVKLLRVLEEHVIERLGSNEQIPVEFRVVAATKVDLLEPIGRGEFREDLYFRVNVAELRVPPLCDRRDDIPLLFNFFAEHFAVRYECDPPSLSSQDIHELMIHAWPGNVRELRNAAERTVIGLGVQGRTISDIIHPPPKTRFSLAEQTEAFEKSIIEQSLSDNKGNIKAITETLDVPRRTLNEKMRKYGLDRKNYI